MLSQSGGWGVGVGRTHIYFWIWKRQKNEENSLWVCYGGMLGDVQVEIVKNLVHKMFVRTFIRLLLSLKVCMCLCKEQKRRVENVHAKLSYVHGACGERVCWGLCLCIEAGRLMVELGGMYFRKKNLRICIHKRFCSLYRCNSMKKFSVVRTYVNFSIFKYTFNHFFWIFPFSTSFTAPTQPPHHLSLTHCNSRHPSALPPHRKQPAQLPNIMFNSLALFHGTW